MANFDLNFASALAPALPGGSSAPQFLGASLKLQIPNGPGPGRISKQGDSGWDALADSGSISEDLDDLGFATIYAIIIEVKSSSPGAKLEFEPSASNGWAPIGAGDIDAGSYYVRTWPAGRAVTGSAKSFDLTADGALSYRIRFLGA